MTDASNREVSSDDPLLLDRQLCFPLYAASKEVMRSYTPLLKPLGLTYTQYLCMMVLWEEGEASVRHLGERLHLDSGTLTPLVRKLEEKGYVRREHNASDARVVDVRLTRAGRALHDDALGVPAAMASCVGLSTEEALELRRLLDKILDTKKETNNTHE